uniref:Uncharacterized protein n=1 Tax=Utricularia reniformis TaxID=192314 RepID=A0A1Y0B2S5_9LAMI|nr:hypothetical protein AEK19_MT1483 [Utricularia reniformis]ART31673.1 hypothetical protein AEK19_MT1483 [Utricularia reniformis]
MNGNSSIHQSFECVDEKMQSIQGKLTGEFSSQTKRMKGYPMVKVLP